MGAMASQITSLTIVYSTFIQAQIKKSTASLGFVREIHRWPVISPHKGPVTRKMFPFDDVIMDEPHGKVPGSGPSNGRRAQCLISEHRRS